MTEPLRNAWADVDLDAIRDNAAALAHRSSPAELCAVVKADGYGHGSVPAAKAAIEGGATRLGVALVEEGRQLREAGITVPILVLSEPQPSAMSEVAAHRLTPTLYTMTGVEAAADTVAEQRCTPLPVHVKVDTGMHRVGADPGDVLSIVQAVHEYDGLWLEGLYTHFAVADDADESFTFTQAERFAGVVAELSERGMLPPMLHSSNSAATLRFPQLHQSMVRCGAALYGVPPSDAVPLPETLRAAMNVRAGVSFVKVVEAGEAISYGQHYRVDRRTVVATIPVGYADGVPRRLGSAGGEVLIHGRRRRIAGSVTMDQIMVDCGDDESVQVGDEAVLLGSQGGEQITTAEWGRLTDSIAYEVVCRIGPRLPRRYQGVRESEMTLDLRSPNRSDRLGDSMPVHEDSLGGWASGEYLYPLRPR